MSTLAEAMATAKEGEKRNFKQSFDLAINLKNIDLKKAENKVKTEVVLPNPLTKKIIIGMFADNLIPQVKELERVILIKKADIPTYDKKTIKNIVNQCASFLSEAPLMPLVGKHFGPVLAVRGKMPKPVPPTLENIEKLVERTRNTIRIALKMSPVIHCIVGTEDMTPEAVAANVDAILKGVEAMLPKGKEQMRNAFIKLTMGKAIKFDVK